MGRCRRAATAGFNFSKAPVQIELHQRVLTHEQSNRLLAAILDNAVLREECDQDDHLRYLLDGHRSMAAFVLAQ